MAGRSYTKRELADIVTRARAGEPASSICKDYGVTRNAILGVVHRAKGQEIKPPKPRASDRIHQPRHHAAAFYPPAKYPYAPDSSCPDFAHDDAHCQAVGVQGFPVLKRSA